MNNNIVEYFQSFLTKPQWFGLFETVIFVFLVFIVFHIKKIGVIYKIYFILFLCFIMINLFFFVENRETIRNKNDGNIIPSYREFFQSLGLFSGIITAILATVGFIFWAATSSSIFQSFIIILLMVGGVSVFFPSTIFKSKLFWFAVLLVVIIIHVIIPYFIKMMTKNNAVELLKKPIYLENETTVSNFEKLHGDVKDNEKFKYRYSLSTWFNINPQPPNTRLAYSKYTNILNYGNKPRVQFNSVENTIRVQAETGDGEIVDVFTDTGNFPFQSWNHIVINYDGGYMDVFLNGKLVASKPNIAPYMQYDDVVVGEDKGLEGGVRNVVYYDRIRTRAEVSLEYKMFK